jgi:hypothetical protein
MIQKKASHLSVKALSYLRLFSKNKLPGEVGHQDDGGIQRDDDQRKFNALSDV